MLEHASDAQGTDRNARELDRFTQLAGCHLFGFHTAMAGQSLGAHARPNDVLRSGFGPLYVVPNG
jgi:hypothetical protein